MLVIAQSNESSFGFTGKIGGRLVPYFFLVRPAWRTYLEVEVLYLPDKEKS